MREIPQKIDLVISIGDRLRDQYYSLKLLAIGKLSRLLMSKQGSRLFRDLRTLCCFIGHGRSGSSLVGALLNAHPNVVMSNELNAFRRLAQGLTPEQLYRLIYIVSRRQAARGSTGGGDYSYAVPNQWQGRHREISVIGDRKSGATAWEISKNPALLTNVIDKVPLELKIIHVVRNPFDVISTTFRKNPPKPTESVQEHLHREIQNYLARCRVVESVERTLGTDRFYNSYHESLVNNPKEEISMLCNFIGVVPSTEYLRDCASIVNRKPRLSRQSIHWDDESVEFVRSSIDRFHWFSSDFSGPGLSQRG